jgi:hypothetical protein
MLDTYRATQSKAIDLGPRRPGCIARRLRWAEVDGCVSRDVFTAESDAVVSFESSHLSCYNCARLVLLRLHAAGA